MNFTAPTAPRKGFREAGSRHVANDPKSLRLLAVMTPNDHVPSQCANRDLGLGEWIVRLLPRQSTGMRMVNQFWHYVDVVTRNAAQLDRQHWVILSVVVFVVGLVCMRGFGSRSNY